MSTGVVPDVRFRLRRSAISWRQLGDEIVVLDIEQSMVLSVNRTAAPLWLALVEGATRLQLLTIAADRFLVDPNEVGEDIDSFVADLTVRGLLDESRPRP